MNANKNVSFSQLEWDVTLQVSGGLVVVEDSRGASEGVLLVCSWVGVILWLLVCALFVLW